MRSWLHPTNQHRSRQNREARYLVSSCKRDEYHDHGLYLGSASLATRWMDLFGERTRFRTFEYRALDTEAVMIDEAA
jgi:hypothetical protein